MISIPVLVGIVIAVMIVEWLILKLGSTQKNTQATHDLLSANQKTEEQLRIISELKATIETSKQDAKAQSAAAADKLTESNLESSRLKQRIAELETRLSEQVQKYKEQIELLNQAKEQMKLEFEHLAQKIFDEKGKVFAQQNQTNLDLILNPFKQQITEFKSKVEEVYITEGKERFSLTEQIKKMHDAYESLSQEANNLVKALKADTKTQGDWGEINLKRILDFTGLKEKVHYFVQPNYQNEAGDNLRPDVVVNLPDNRQIIVDSKVSLTGYERYFRATEDLEKEQGVKDHLKSIRKHVQELSEKKYEHLKGINTLDFVLMFVPVEAAYFVAIDHDAELYKYASEKQVLLVCPSTLLITLQLVQSLWRIDDQKKHVYEIADLGGKLHDKFVGFAENFESIKTNLDKTQKAYDEAYGQLKDGKGNLINQAKKLKELGINSKKKLPDKLLAAAQEEEVEPDNADISLP